MNDNDEWNKEVINILEKVRVNSINLSEYHRLRYYYYKGYSKYFDIPVLVLSTLSGSFSVGSQAYLEQSIISVIGCAISMLITIITSIKLYLNIQDNLQVELTMSKDFYALAIDIYKVLALPNNLRGEKGISYLNKKYSLYNKLVETSDLLQKKNKHDQLVIINAELMNDYSNMNSNSDDNVEMTNINKKYELPVIVNSPNNKIDPISVYNAAQVKSNMNPIQQLTNYQNNLDNTNKSRTYMPLRDIPQQNMYQAYMPPQNTSQRYIPQFNIDQSNISQQNMPQVNMHQVNMPQVNIDQSDMPQVNIPQVNIPQVNIPQVNIDQSNISQVNMPQVNMPQVNIPQVNMPQVNIDQSNIPQVNIDQSNIPQVNIPQVNIPQVNIDQSNIPQVNIDQSNMPQVNIDQSNIPQVNIPQVNIPQVNTDQPNTNQSNTNQSNTDQPNIKDENESFGDLISMFESNKKKKKKNNK
jgi:uncharacterized protein YjbI with pentapeptide repeats